MSGTTVDIAAAAARDRPRRTPEHRGQRMPAECRPDGWGCRPAGAADQAGDEPLRRYLGDATAA